MARKAETNDVVPVPVPISPVPADRLARQPRMIPRGAYEADLDKVALTRWLALFFCGITLFSLAPVVWLHHFNLGSAPGWARVVVLAAILQIVLAAWMASAPDWATVWVTTVVLGFAAGAYAVVAAMAMVTPLDHPLPLGMGEVRTNAVQWCGAMMATFSLATYVGGRMSGRWQARVRRARERLSRG